MTTGTIIVPTEPAVSLVRTQPGVLALSGVWTAVLRAAPTPVELRFPVAPVHAVLIDSDLVSLLLLSLSIILRFLIFSCLSL